MASGGKKSAKFTAFLDQKYIPLDNRIKLAVFVVAIILPIGLFYFFFLSPNLQEIDKLTQQKASLSAEIAKAKKAEAELANIKAEVARTEEQFKETANLLPKEKEIPGLLRNISDLGKRAGLDFQSFRPGNEIPRDFYAEIPVDIQIIGPYHNLGYFLDQVSKLERIVTVDNIQMGSPREEDMEIVLSSSCRLKTYRFTGVQQAPANKGRR